MTFDDRCDVDDACESGNSAPEASPPEMPGWDAVLADFDKHAFKAGDVVSDAWISHVMRVPAPSELPPSMSPRDAISARDRWQRTCTALVEKVRESRKMHLTSVCDGYVILEDRAVGDHEMRKFSNAVIAHSERVSGRLDLVRVEALSTGERDRLLRQKQALSLFQRTALPKMRKSIGPGE